MSRDLLIDGYNLLHAAGLARRSYGPGDLERARLALLRLIAGQMTDDQRQRTTFVFDAKDPPPTADRYATFALMLVLYAHEDEEADDMIERLIAAHSAPRSLIVVSGDHRLHKAARRRKATAIDSETFLDECARHVYCRRSPRAEPELKPGAESTPAEIAELLAVFAVDVHELADDPEPLRSRSQATAARPGSPAASGPRASRRKRGTRKAPAAPSSPQPAPTGEDLAFWEARIADLFRRHPEEFTDDR